jgi:hypothetical protein
MPCVVPMMPYGPRGRFGPIGFYGPGLMVVPCPSGPAPRQFVSLPAGFAPVPPRLISFTSVPDPIAQDKAVSPPAPVAKAEPNATSPAATAQASKQHKPGAKQIVGNDIPKHPEPGRSSATELASAESEITGAIPAPSRQASGSPRRNLISAIGLGLAALLFFSTALLLSRRRSRALQVAVPIDREPIEPNLLRRTSAPGSLDAAARRPHEQARPAERPATAEWLPSTLGEAFAVLGASPETGDDVLNKLVKGLRRRWHPDHALHEEDRRVRERRLKQINVAWDIVSGKRRRPSNRTRAA